MADTDGSRLSMLSVDYDLWMGGVESMSQNNFQVAPDFTYLVPTYAAKEIVFDEEEDGNAPFAAEFSEIRAEADDGWNRAGAIANAKSGLVRWESPISKGVLQARRSGKKGPWTVE